MPDRMVRAGGIAGIVFVVLILITVFSAGSPPAADDAVDKIRTFMDDHRSALLITNFIGILATPFVIWFFVVLRDVLRGDETTNALGTAMLSGVVVTAGLAMAGGAVSVAGVYVDGGIAKLGDDTVRIVYEIQSLMFAATSGGLVLMAVAAAWAIRRSGGLPAYTMWLALLAAVGNLVTMASTLGAGAAMLAFFGVGTLALFVLVTGITMAAGKATPGAAAAST